MNNIQHHNIIVGQEFIFGKDGQWKIKNKQVNFSSLYYHIPIFLYELNEGNWKEIGLLDLKFKKNEEQEFKRIENSYFEFKINNMTLSNNGKIIFGIEIKEIIQNKDFQCYYCLLNRQPLFTCIKDETRKSFCSKECLFLEGRKRKFEFEDEDENKPQKKIRIDYSIKELDILMIGQDHGYRERILSKNIKDCLNEFSLQFNTIKFNTKKRKPFLIFWETLNREDQEKSINLSEINGRETQSWVLPLDPDVMGSFSFMQSAYVSFLYPVNYSDNGTPDINENAMIQKNIGEQHGYKDDKINFKRDGYESPIGIWCAWSFVYMFLDYILINGIDNTTFLKIFIPDNDIIKSFIEDLRQLWITLVKFNILIIREKINKKVYENLSVITFDNIESLKEQALILINEMLPLNLDLLFTKESHRTVLDIIHREDYILYKYVYAILKIFIIKYWLKIAALVDASKVNYPFDTELYINLNYTRNFDPIINENFFLKLIEELNSSLTIDIPTLLYTMFMKNMMKNKKFNPSKNDRDIILKTRDFVSAQTIIDICNFKKIKRCIIFHGTAHTKSLSEIFEYDGSIKSNDAIEHRITKYNMYNIDLNKMGIDVTQEDKDTKSRINETLNLLVLHVMLERIDIWLWKTENLKDKQIILPIDFGDDLKKLQYHSKLLHYFLEMPKNDEKNIETLLKQYIGLLLSTNVPIYDDNDDDYELSKLDLIPNALNSFNHKPKTFLTRKNGKLFKQNVWLKRNGMDTYVNTFTNFIEFIKFINNNQSLTDIESMIIL